MCIRDRVCLNGGWLGLVYGDYEAVMPLALNTKIPLMPRIIHPIFAQQLGIFGQSPASEDQTIQFLAAIPKKYKNVYLQFNEDNKIPKSRLSESTERINYTLALNKAYEDLHNGFSKNMKRNIKIGKKNGCQAEQLAVDKFCEFYLANTPEKTIQNHDLERLLPSLLTALIKNKAAKILSVKNEDGKIVAACLLTIFKSRLTYLMARSSEQGKQKRAMHFIIDSIIREYAGGDYILDFEGSEIESIANFYSFFNAIPNSYPTLSYQSFPFSLV